MTPRIAIIVGSTRPGRKGSAVGQWVLEQAKEREGASYDLLELADFGLGLLAEATVPGDADRAYENEQTRAWSRAIDAYDGFVWVTPEYNHGVPAAFKNALDLLYLEWNHKAVGLVGYGVDGGVRAVEHWRQILANVRMIVVRGQCSLSTFRDWRDGAFTPTERRPRELKGVLDQLEEMAGLLAPLRS